MNNFSSLFGSDGDGFTDLFEDSLFDGLFEDDAVADSSADVGEQYTGFDELFDSGEKNSQRLPVEKLGMVRPTRPDIHPVC